MDCSPPGSSVHGISQALILVWVAIPFSWGSSLPMDQTHGSCTGKWILYTTESPGKPQSNKLDGKVEAMQLNKGKT